MGMANRVSRFLDRHGVRYDVVHHRHTSTSIESARAARVPPDHVAKCVLLEDERGYLMAVVPASRRISLHAVRDQLGRGLKLASEIDLWHLLADCEVGAVPPIGEPYDIPTLVDERLIDLEDVYFEGGDHEDLVHVEGDSFRRLLQRARQGRFSAPV